MPFQINQTYYSDYHIEQFREEITDIIFEETFWGDRNSGTLNEWSFRISVGGYRGYRPKIRGSYKPIDNETKVHIKITAGLRAYINVVGSGLAILVLLSIIFEMLLETQDSQKLMMGLSFSLVGLGAAIFFLMRPWFIIRQIKKDLENYLRLSSVV